MYERYRFLTTVVVWLAFAAIVITVVVSLATTAGDIPEESFFAIALFVMFLTAVTGFSTARIWRDATPVLDEQNESQRQAAKAKRASRERLKRLVEVLDEDEIIELETLLLAQEPDLMAYDE